MQAKTPQSELIQRVWGRLEAVVKREVETGCWNDKNFSKLLEATKKGLIFLCENDRYYKRWLGLVSVFLVEEVLREKREFTFDKALELSARPLMLTREEFERHRDSLFELYLCGYLYGLSMVSEGDVARIREARQTSTSLDFPTEDPKAHFTLYFPKGELPFFRLCFKEREGSYGSEKREE